MNCSEWIEVKLEDITTNHNSLRLPLSSKERSVRKGCYPYYGAQGIIDYIDDYIFEGEYLLVAEDGANLETRNETIARLTSKGEKFWVNNHAHILRANDKSDIRYILYHLNRVDLSSYITGSAQPKLNKANLNSIQVKLPPLQEQKAIAHILSTLDEKIEVNSKINKTLEEMAQAIFKHWFVDFEFPNEDGEPYKSSGGEMVDSELGPIPKGWEIGIIDDYIAKTKGGDWGKERPEGNYLTKVKCIRGADIDDLTLGRKGNAPTRYILEKNFNSKKLVNGNLIVEISGGSPTQSTGRIAYISEEIIKRNSDPIICTNFCRAIELEDPDLMFFVFNYWRYLYSGNLFFNYENGTTGIKNLDINSFIEGYLIVKPTKGVLRTYSSIVGNFDKMIQNNGISNEVLSAIRDTLLPKLMSGEISVPIDN